MNRRIRVVTFDAMETLIHLRGPIGKIYSDFARRRFRIEAEADSLQTAFREVFHRYDRKWPCYGFYHADSSISQKLWWTTVVRETFSTANKNIDADVLDSLCDALFDYFATKDAWTLDPSAESVFELLTRKGISIAVLSNFDSRLRRILSEFRLDDYFHAYFLSGETGLAKPNARLFALVEKMMIANGDEIAHVGDNAEKDYVCAKSFGWHAFLYRPPHSVAGRSAAAPGDVIADLSDLKRVLK